MCQHTNCLTVQYNKIDASLVSVAGRHKLRSLPLLSISCPTPLPLSQGAPKRCLKYQMPDYVF
jgi:hypothetical protein